MHVAIKRCRNTSTHAYTHGAFMPSGSYNHCKCIDTYKNRHFQENPYTVIRVHMRARYKHMRWKQTGLRFKVLQQVVYHPCIDFECKHHNTSGLPQPPQQHLQSTRSQLYHVCAQCQACQSRISSAQGVFVFNMHTLPREHNVVLAKIVRFAHACAFQWCMTSFRLFVHVLHVGVTHDDLILWCSTHLAASQTQTDTDRHRHTHAHLAAALCRRDTRPAHWGRQPYCASQHRRTCPTDSALPFLSYKKMYVCMYVRRHARMQEYKSTSMHGSVCIYVRK